MEDVTTTSAGFTKDELAVAARHPISQSVKQIVGLKHGMMKHAKDTSRAPRVIYESVKDKFDRAVALWERLGPSIALARRLFPQHGEFFDLLDKALAVKQALDDLSANKPLRTSNACSDLCCKTVL